VVLPARIGQPGGFEPASLFRRQRVQVWMRNAHLHCDARIPG